MSKTYDILTNPCGCAIEEINGEDQFRYCPLHAAAEEMRALLRLVMDDDDTRALYAEEWQAIVDATEGK